jgi:hypothetical protein
MRPAALLALLLLLSLAPGRRARAGRCEDASEAAFARCSCRRGTSAEEWRDLASTVVLGTVVADTAAMLDFHGDGRRYGARIVTLVVGARWKGPEADTLRIHTGRGGGDCGFHFRVGESYLVFASGQADGLWTGICWPTARAAAVDRTLRDAIGRSTVNRYPVTNPLHRW